MLYFIGVTYFDGACQIYTVVYNYLYTLHTQYYASLKRMILGVFIILDHLASETPVGYVYLNQLHLSEK